jgi:hypothetical protein
MLRRNGRGLGVDNKVVLRFDRPFWPSAASPLFRKAYIQCTDPRFRFVDLHKFGKHGTIVAHVSPPWSCEGYATLSDEQVVQEVLRCLGKMFPHVAGLGDNPPTLPAATAAAALTPGSSQQPLTAQQATAGAHVPDADASPAKKSPGRAPVLPAAQDDAAPLEPPPADAAAASSLIVNPDDALSAKCAASSALPLEPEQQAASIGAGMNRAAPAAAARPRTEAAAAAAAEGAGRPELSPAAVVNPAAAAAHSSVAVGATDRTEQWRRRVDTGGGAEGTCVKDPPPVHHPAPAAAAAADCPGNGQRCGVMGRCPGRPEQMATRRHRKAAIVWDPCAATAAGPPRPPPALCRLPGARRPAPGAEVCAQPQVPPALPRPAPLPIRTATTHGAPTTTADDAHRRQNASSSSASKSSARDGGGAGKAASCSATAASGKSGRRRPAAAAAALAAAAAVPPRLLDSFVTRWKEDPYACGTVRACSV